MLGWDDTQHRHPSIVEMMAAYIAKMGDNVYVGELFDAAGVQSLDMPIPTSTQFASANRTTAYLCWNLLLGCCKFRKGSKYQRSHPRANKLPDDDNTKVLDVLKKGVDYVVSKKEPTMKKIKPEGGAV